jgi:hypothetical protein
MAASIIILAIDRRAATAVFQSTPIITGRETGNVSKPYQQP